MTLTDAELAEIKALFTIAPRRARSAEQHLGEYIAAVPKLLAELETARALLDEAAAQMENVGGAPVTVARVRTYLAGRRAQEKETDVT